MTNTENNTSEENATTTIDEQIVTPIEPTFEEKYLEVNDKYLRLYADFENFKKRTYSENVNIAKTANRSVMIDMITTLDDMERALNNMSDSADKTGVNLIYTKLKDTLKNKGLESYDSMNTPFNADLHESITQVITTEENDGKVIDEIEKGYKLNGIIIRYAKVVVGTKEVI